MKKYVSGKTALSAVLGLTLLFGANYVQVANAAPVSASTEVAVNVQVKQESKGNVDWMKGSDSVVTAIGVGLPPANAGVSRTPLARRAAIVDAYRILAETIQGVQINSETLMKDLVIQSDVVRAKVDALVKGARIVEEKANPDGSYTVKMSIPLYGAVNSVASVAIPEIKESSAPAPLPQVKKTNLPKNEIKEARQAAFTGVIVDASGLGLEATFSPVIYDVDGRAIYGMKNIDADFAISKGMVEYAATKADAVAGSRAGARPLVVKAVDVRGGGNSVNPVNVVISVNDGDKILLANERSKMLQRCAVVFVK